MINEPIWHNISANKALEYLKSSKQGLTFEEANKRLRKYGRNKLPEAKKFSALIGFFIQFKSPLVYILIIAAAIALTLKEFIDMSIILAAAFINSSIGFFQEYKAEKTFEHLKQLVEYKARVLRRGSMDSPSSTHINEEHIINSETVVPGDIIVLEAGDIVPADARLIESHNLETKEAALTGESIPSSKNPETLDKGAPLADRENIVYFGTVVVRGKAHAVVISTGLDTELGKIADLIKTTQEEKTPLQKKIASLARALGITIAILTLILFIAGVLSGRSFIEMLLVSVAVAVAGIPEGLAIAVTITLAVGMQRILKKNALTRKLIAAETLGSITIIASDKTGTLTLGKMTISHILPFKKTTPDKILQIGLLCNNTIVENPEEELKKWELSGDTTEIALLHGAVAAGLEREKLREKFSRIDEIPFESETMYMATLHDVPLKDRSALNGKNIVFIKGAPERILALCDIKPDEIKKIKKEFDGLTTKGLRVLAFAQKPIHESITQLSNDHLKNSTFMGLIALKDPLRLGAKQAIDDCKKAHIRPIIVTGDHKLTAQTIAQEIGLIKEKDIVLEGVDLDKLSDENLAEELKRISVFARVEPKHKIRIINALQKQGEVVAMTGDGVNDAPAIKSADVGIALGSGSEITKETADIVLLDDHFQTIIDAIRTGRTIFNNIKKIILFLLANTFSEFILVGAAILFGLPLPVLAGQILWVNIIEDTFPAMALSYEKEKKEILGEKTRGHETKILDNEMKFLIFIIGIVMNLILLTLFLYLYHLGKDIVYIRTMIFVGLGIDALFYVFACKDLKRFIWQYNPFDNIFLNISIIFGYFMFFIALYIPFFQDILRVVPLNFYDWLVLVGFGILTLGLIEFGKLLFIKNKLKNERM